MMFCGAAHVGRKSERTDRESALRRSTTVIGHIDPHAPIFKHVVRKWLPECCNRVNSALARDREEDRLHGRDLAEMGWSGRTRPG